MRQKATLGGNSNEDATLESGTKSFLASPHITSFQAEPNWLISFVPATRAAQFLKSQQQLENLKRAHFFSPLKTLGKLQQAGQQPGQLRCQMSQYAPAALKGTYFPAYFPHTCLFCFQHTHTHSCCGVFHIPSLLPPARTPHAGELCSAMAAERRSPSQKDVSWSSFHALFTLTRHSLCSWLL